MSVLGQDLGYTVKYNPLPSGKGLYLTVYPSSRPNTDTVCLAILGYIHGCFGLFWCALQPAIHAKSTYMGAILNEYLVTVNIYIYIKK